MRIKQALITRRSFTLVAALMLCLSGSITRSDSVAELRVLFIGNSLTFANDLPAIVQSLAESAGKPKLAYKMIARPDFSLEDHWNQGDARKAIADGKWDVVVLQQGPSALPESRKLLIEYTRRFDDEIRRRGAKTALYMVWPSRARFGDFDRVVESYAQAAQSVSATLLPVGRAWQVAWREKGDFALYSEDNFHPSVAGSYLAAVVIYQQLYGDTQIAAPSSLKPKSKSISKIELSAEDAALISRAARGASENNRSR
jgi:hypothetical protein